MLTVKVEYLYRPYMAVGNPKYFIIIKRSA